MTSESEHTNRQRSPQQAQGRQWPILVLLLGLAALALALTACGGPSSTSAPDVTSATRVPEWEETVEFSLKWLDTHLVEIPVERCEQVKFHVVASNMVGLGYRDPARGHVTMDSSDDYSSSIAIEESGILALEARHAGFGGQETTIDVTISYRIDPYSQGFCFPTS